MFDDVRVHGKNQRRTSGLVCSKGNAQTGGGDKRGTGGNQSVARGMHRWEQVSDGKRDQEHQGCGGNEWNERGGGGKSNDSWKEHGGS